MKLWVDDKRPAPEGWMWARTAPEAIELLAGGTVSVVSLDHDLGEDAGTGNDVLTWVEERVFTDPGYRAPDVLIHTANISARVKMELGVAAIRRRLERRRTDRGTR